MSEKKKSNAEFLRWFKPIIEALKELGGSAKPEEVYKKIADDLCLSNDIVNQSYSKTGNNRFKNQVAFARNYLVYAGYIDKSVRGIWTLTESGKSVNMTDNLASDIFIENYSRLSQEKKFVYRNLSNSDADALYDEFNKRFPLEKLSEMTLAQYSNNNREDSFCYWIETKTQNLGSIWGGSAYKFGIFKFSGTLKFDVKTLKDDEYAWYSKYGNNREEVFENIKSNIIKIAKAARNENYSEIDEIDLGDAFKWKIAFLYSQKKLINWFKKEILLKFADFYGKTVRKNTPISELQLLLIAEKGDENLWDFSRRLLSIWNEMKNQDTENNLNTENSIHYWIYSPGENAFKWEEFHEKGIMALGWEELGDLREYDSRDEIKKSLQEQYTNSSCINSSLATWQFANEMKVGDVVFVKKGMYKIIGRGVVSGDYEFDENRTDYNHVRKVNWTHDGEWKYPGQAVMKTLTDIKPQAA